MFLYNISIIVEENNNEQLVQWIIGTWIPTINNPQIKFLKMLDSPHEGHTYCVQLIAHEQDEIHTFQAEFLSQLQEQIAIHHREKAFIFDSKMQYLSL